MRSGLSRLSENLPKGEPIHPPTYAAVTFRTAFVYQLPL